MKLRSIAVVWFFLTFFQNSTTAQLSVQLNTGLMNYGGDLQNKPYTFSEAKLTVGANLKYSIQKFGVRIGFTYGSIQGDDEKMKEYAARNLSFKSTITEGNLCFEYDFIPADDHKLIPYLFAGVGVYHYNPYTYYNNAKVYLQPLGTEGEGLAIYPDRKMYNLTNFEIPLGAGIQYKLSSNLLVGVEFNSRYLFTDYLDDVSKTYPKESELFKERGQLAVDLSYRSDELDPSLTFPAEGKKRGNPKQNDNYYTSVITLTYIFSGNSLFGNSFGHNGHAINCPKKVQ